MKPTEAAVGIVATRSVAWLQNADLRLARTERVRAVSLRLYRISPGLPVGSIVVTRTSRSSKNPVDSQDTKAHEECSSCA